MNVIDAIADFFLRHMPHRGVMREEDVYDMRYRYRYFSLFPEDLNEDYDPHNFIEEPVEPKSFRKILTALLGWTVLIPLVLFFVLQQRHINTLTHVFDERQEMVANLVKVHADETLEMLSGQLSNIVCAGLIREDGTFGHTAGADELLRLLRRTAPVTFVQVRDERTGKSFEAGVSLKPGAGFLRTSGDSSRFTEIRTEKGEGVLAVSISEPEKQLGIYAEVPLSVFFHIIGEASPDGALNIAIFNGRGQEIASNFNTATGQPADAEKEKKYQRDVSTVGFAHQLSPDAVRATVLPLGVGGWYVTVRQPPGERAAEMKDDIITGSLLFLFAVSSVFFVGFIVGRPLSRSVGELSEELEFFSRTGNPPKIPERLSENGPAELFGFAVKFRKMAEEVSATQKRLRLMNQTLEKRVTERTNAIRARNAELATLQRLLAPIRSPLDRLIGETVIRFRKMLGLQKLNFHSVNELNEKNLKAEEFLMQDALIPVRVENQLFGWLETEPETLDDREVRNSLERLANSIGIVLMNRRLLSSSVRQHQILNEIFSSMTEGVLLLNAEGGVAQKNAYLEKLIGCVPEKPGKFYPYIEANFEIERFSSDPDERKKKGDVLLPFAPGGSYVLKPKVTDGNPEGKGRVLGVTAFEVQSSSLEQQNMVTGLMIRDISANAKMERLKDQLISVVAHELKTPITALRLQAETLASQIGLSDAERNQILKDMQEESLRLRALVDDWLDVTQFREGVVKLSPKIVHIATPIDRAARVVRTRFDLNVIRKISPDCECFRFDPERITQVFINLFSNAARYRSEDRPAEVTVTVTREGEFVRIAVEDNGVGIPKEKLPFVFERFYQIDMSIARKRGGVGLGLTIVKGIAEAHGGSVSVDSCEGAWTRFVIMLPY